MSQRIKNINTRQHASNHLTGRRLVETGADDMENMCGENGRGMVWGGWERSEDGCGATSGSGDTARRLGPEVSVVSGWGGEQPYSKLKL